MSESQQGVVSRLCFVEFLTTPSCKHLTTLRQISQGLGLGLIFRYNISSGKRTQDLLGFVSGYGQVVGIGECGNETSVFIKCGEFLD